MNKDTRDLLNKPQDLTYLLPHHFRYTNPLDELLQTERLEFSRTAIETKQVAGANTIMGAGDTVLKMYEHLFGVNASVYYDIRQMVSHIGVGEYIEKPDYNVDDDEVLSLVNSGIELTVPGTETKVRLYMKAIGERDGYVTVHTDGLETNNYVLPINNYTRQYSMEITVPEDRKVKISTLTAWGQEVKVWDFDWKEVYVIPEDGLREIEISREDFMDSIVTNSLIDLAVYEVEGGVDVKFIDGINKSGLLDGILLFVYEGDGKVSYHKEIDIFTTRRERLLNRQSLNPPFTVKFIQNRLDEILGEGNYTLEIDYENSAIIVENTSTSQAWAEELFITINNVKPASMLYINRPVDISNLYVNESIHMSQYLYNYRLGTRWVLGRKPFLSFEDKGEVKSLAVKSITPALHHKVAQFIIGATTKVRINGSHIITTFTSKTVDENEANIIYDVAFGSVDSVTKIELMDDENNVLSTTNLFIPIPDDTQIRHRIPVTSN